MSKPKTLLEVFSWSPTEKQFQGAVREYAQALGYRDYCVWNSQHSPPGWPDLVLLRPPRALFVELKSAKGKVSVAQKETLALLEACGLETHTWWPNDWEEIEKVLA
jgi:hypothetical protein